MHFRVRYLDAIAVPERGAALVRELGAAYFEVVVVPEWVAQVEEAVFNLHVPALFEGALAVGGAVEGAAAHEHAVASVESALGVHRLVFYDSHM